MHARKNWFRRYRLAASFGLVTGTVAVVLWTTFAVVDGEYQLPVAVATAESNTLRAVHADVFSRRDDARHALDRWQPSESKSQSATLRPYNGGPLLVHVPYTKHVCVGGWVWRYSQFEWINVRAEFTDGRQVGKTVELPDLTRIQSLTVAIP